MKFTTESGTVYEIDEAEQKIRRVSKRRGNDKRGDGEWLRLLTTPSIELGHRALLVMEPLNSLGPDDAPWDGEEADCTVRLTTPIISIDKAKEATA